MSDWSGVSMVAVLIPVAAIVGVFALGITSVIYRSRLRELEIRQRIAMIEKGLVPPPEVDPAGFDRAMSRLEHRVWPGVTPRGAGRHRRAGIILIGLGVGLMVLIGVAGQAPDAGVGIGGFLAVLGIAFLVIGFLEHSPTGPAGTGTVADKPQQP
ncbi:MAG: DUF6249 domain-containing protein [Betaproteobacteria bacterium]